MVLKPITDADKLNSIIERLSAENARYRKQAEAVEAEIAKRAPKAHGLKLKEAVRTILDERDEAEEKNEDKIEFLKKIYRLLLQEKASEALKALNVYLFNRSF